MEKAVVENLTNDQRVKVAVAYLLREKDQRPKSIEKFFEKLDTCEAAARQTNMAISKSREALTHLETKFYHLMGSIDTLSELISDELVSEGDANIAEWCEKYQPPQSLPSMIPGGVDMPGNANVPAGVDIAGSTAHDQ